MPARSGKSSRAKHHTFLTPEDAADFSAALRETFPNIAFLPMYYEDWLVDWEATEKTEEWKISNRNPTAMEVVVPLPPSEWNFPLSDSVHTTGDRQVWALLLPPDWEPDWYQHPISNRPIVKNEPPVFFAFYCSEFRTTRVMGAFEEPPEIEEDDEVITLQEGKLYAYWAKEDAEHRKGVGKVFRIFDKLTTNKYVQVDRETGGIQAVVEKGGMDWIGYHALDWARQHPRHFIDEDLKPLDWRPSD